jgi:hypothetical protein
MTKGSIKQSSSKNNQTLSNDKKSSDSPPRTQIKDEVTLLKEHLEEARQATRLAMER